MSREAKAYLQHVEAFNQALALAIGADVATVAELGLAQAPADNLQETISSLSIGEDEYPLPGADGKKGVDGSRSNGMMKLHTLLTTGQGPSRRKRTTLVKAEMGDLLYRRYQHDAAEIRNQPHEEEIDPFPFLAMPTELRLHVYAELLVTDDSITLTWRGPRKAGMHQKKIFTDIMQTCKLCAAEGARVLYGENVFDLGHVALRPSFSRVFTRVITAQNLSLIRVVVADHRAASEDLSNYRTAWNFEPPCALNAPRMSAFIKQFNISISNLRLFAVCIAPYGSQEDGSSALIAKVAPEIRDNMDEREMWFEKKNEGLHALVDGICSGSNKVLRKVDMGYVDKNICFDWVTIRRMRPWVVWTRDVAV